jgi:hypothetical protein
MTNIAMPDGTVVSFPDDMPKDQIKGLISQKFPDIAKLTPDKMPSPPSMQQKKPDGLISDIGQDVKKRETDAGQIQQDYQQGKTSKTGEILDLAGKSGAGLVSDIGGDIAKKAVSLVPDAIKKPIEQVGGNAINAFLSSDIGRTAMKAATAGQGEWESFKTANPVAARHVESIANMMMVGLPGEKVGEGVIDAGKGAVEAAGKGVNKVAQGVDKITDTAKLASEGLGARDLEELKAAHQDIKDTGSALYNESEKAGAVLTPSAIQKVVAPLDKIVSESDTKAAKGLYGKTLKAIQDLKDDVSSGNVSLKTLDRHRQILGNLGKDIANPNKAQEAEAAGRAISAIDDAVNKLGKKDIVSGNTDAIASLNEGRAHWAKAANFGKIVKIVENSEGDPDKIRRGFKTLLKSSKNMLGFKPNEVSQIKEAAKGKSVQKIMSTLSKVPGAGRAVQYGRGAISKGKTERVLQEIEKRGVKAPEEWDTTKDIRAAEPQKLLAAPKKEFLAYSDGIIRQQTEKELSDAIANRGKYSQLGMNPDIQKRIFEHEIRNKFKDVWSELDSETKQKVKDQVDKAWADHKKSLHDIVKNSVQSIQGQGDTYAPTVMSQAMMQAKGLK